MVAITQVKITFLACWVMSARLSMHTISTYENFILIGDFNAESSECSLCEFCDVYNLENLIDEPTCYKNPNNPSSIDVILTNRKRSFHISTTIETGLSDHHKMIITVLNGS